MQKDKHLPPPDQVDAPAAASRLEVVYRISATYSLKLPHYVILAPIRTFFSSMRATKRNVDTGFGYVIIRCTAFPIGWQCHVFADYKVFPVWYANKKLLQILSAVILPKQFEKVDMKNFLFGLRRF